MAKKDVGRKMEELYDAPSSKNEKIYPTVYLPAELFDKSYKVGDKCTIEFEGTIENMGKKEYSVKIHSAEEVETPGESKREKNLLDK